MLEKQSRVPGPALLEMGDQHHRTSSATAPASTRPAEHPPLHRAWL